MINFETTTEVKQEDLKIERITTEDIDTKVPESGETKIILTRHGEYERENENSMGKLTKEGNINSYDTSRVLMEDMIKQIPENEREQLVVLTVGSPTKYGDGQRSIETSQEMLRATEDAFEAHDISTDQIMNMDKNIDTDTSIEKNAAENKSEGAQPRIMVDTEEPRMFAENVEYLNFLTEKYGDGTQPFWQHFEEDTHKDRREEIGAEGPAELLRRYAHSVDVLARFAKKYHTKFNGEKRLVIMGASHYDTVSPFLKNHVLPEKKQEDYLPVDFNAGFAINIDTNNNAIVNIDGRELAVELQQKGKRLGYTEWNKKRETPSTERDASRL